MYRASNVQHEHADPARALECGGIGAVHRLARQTGLLEAIDAHVRVLKVHLPYHELDHVLGMAYNVLCGGTCLQDIELRRQNEVYLDALGAQRIPDATTAGDSCRRFDEAAIEALHTAVNETRVRVWRAQPEAFFDEAVVDADKTIAETTGQCKKGMDIAYNGMWRIARTKALSPGPSQSRGARQRPQLLAPPGPCPVESTADPLLRLQAGRRAGRPAGGTGRQAHRTSAGSALPAVRGRLQGVSSRSPGGSSPLSTWVSGCVVRVLSVV
jgi:hypothetical protein